MNTIFKLFFVLMFFGLLFVWDLQQKQWIIDVDFVVDLGMIYVIFALGVCMGISAKKEGIRKPLVHIQYDEQSQHPFDELITDYDETLGKLVEDDDKK